MVSRERCTQPTGFTVACSDNATYTFLPFSSYWTKSHRFPWFQFLVDTAQKPPSQLAAAGTFSKSICGEAQKWLAWDLLEVVSPQGQSTARKVFFPALCPRYRQMTSLGKAARKAPSPAVIPAVGTYQPLITKIIRLHLQRSSQHHLQSGNWSPGLFHYVRRVQINRCSLGSWKRGQEWGKQCMAGEVWWWFSSVLRLLYLHTFAQSMYTKGSGCLLEVWQGLAASAQEVTKKCSHLQTQLWLHPRFCRRDGPPHLLLLPSSPDCRRTKHNKWSWDWCYYLSFLKLVLALAHGTNYVSRQQFKTQRK